MTERATQQEVVQATSAAEAAMQPQVVPVNVYEAPSAMVILAPLPAVKADDVSVELRPGFVRFWAHLRSEGPREYLVHEWSYGGFEREVDVPDGFGAGVEATLGNGQLAVRVLRGDVAPDTITIHPTAV